ncbi:MAG: hypothetical protein ACRDTG_00690 [Pseudonocardiaceae bacterium]
MTLTTDGGSCERDTAYEQQARKLGIVGDLNPDGYTYAYRCVDPR